MNIFNRVKNWQSLFAFIVFIVLGLPSNSYAISDCAIGLKESVVLPTIDGTEEGAEWTDPATSTLDSSVASSCLNPLKDYLSGIDDYTDRQVTIKSKRYQRDGQWYLGFLFTVRDLTDTGSCGIGTLCVGETIVMQFNPNINGDDELFVGEDKRFLLNHKWQSTGGDPDVIDDVTLSVEPSINDPLCPSTSNKQFSSSTDTGITYQFRKGIAGGGYQAEIEVPVAFIDASGTLAEDIGIAIAVVNEFGKDSFAGTPDYECTAATGSCEAAGSSFPNSLAIVNYENPVDAVCEFGWTTPKQWGVGYLNDPPGSYSISRSPVFWNSDAIRVYECDSLGYTYYPGHPCRVKIEADIENSGAVVTKKVAFLWAKHGTGDPSEYNFVDLQDVVLASGTTTTVSSALWGGMPRNETNHPCLRVYVFPDTLSPADEDILRGAASGGVVTKGQLDGLYTGYINNVNHWAQKNISKHASETHCPDAGCRVAMNNPDSKLKIEFMSSAHALDSEFAVDVGGQEEVMAKFVTGDLLHFSKEHVMVQVKTVAYKLLPEGEKPKYSFIQDFGGIVQVYPLKMVQESARLPLEFLVSNFSDKTMRIKLFADLYQPPGAEEVSLSVTGVGENIITLEPGTEVTVNAALLNAAIDVGNNDQGSEPDNGKDPFYEVKILLFILFVVIILMLIIKWFSRSQNNSA